jgi:hypothetical protein
MGAQYQNGKREARATQDKGNYGYGATIYLK